jgi:nitrite reductase (NO-forming)
MALTQLAREGGVRMKTTKVLVSIAIAVFVALSFVSLPAALAATYKDYVAKDPTEVPPPMTRSNAQTVEVELWVEEVVTEIDPGKSSWVWTYSGTVPGPMIRAMEGDTVVVTLHNYPQSCEGDLPENCGTPNEEPHNIDFHAAMGPGGGAAVTNVDVGETRTFSFKAMRQGAYIYHCAGEGKPWEHVAYGMYGLILIEPKGGLKSDASKPKKSVKEFYIGQSDWYHDVQNDNGVYILDEEKASMEHPILFTFNGHKNALTGPAPLFGNAIQTNQDETARFFFVNGGPNIGSNWHIIGTIFDDVCKGHFKVCERNEETVYVPPGSAAMFELSTPVPGTFFIVDHALFRVPKGALGFLNVNQVASWPEEIYSPNPDDLLP